MTCSCQPTVSHDGEQNVNADIEIEIDIRGDSILDTSNILYVIIYVIEKD